MKAVKNYALLISMLFFIIACSSDNGPVDVTTPDPIVGTWELIELNISPPQDINGDGNSTSNILTDLDCVSGTLTFREDRTWDLSFDGVTITHITGGLFIFRCANFTSGGAGTWQLQNNQLTLFQGTTSIFYMLNGNRLTNSVGEDLPGFRSEVYEKQ
jgi:hypothetical protein